MRSAVALVFVFVVVIGCSLTDDTLVVGPPSSRAATLVLLPGAGCTPEHYRPLAEAIVRRSTDNDFGLWVAVPAPPGPLGPLPWDVAPLVARARRAVETAGGPDPGDAASPWFIGGHSLGGAMAQLWNASGQTGRYAGRVLLAAVLGRHHRCPDVAAACATPPGGRPTLVVAGSLDGRMRLTRVAEEPFHWAALAAVSLVVVDGMTHMQFADASGQDEYPPAEVSTAHAVVTVAAAVVAFVGAVDPRTAPEARARAVASLAAADHAARRAVAPIWTAYAAEGSRHFAARAQCGGPDERIAHACRPVCPGVGSPAAAAAQAALADTDALGAALGRPVFSENRFADLLQDAVRGGGNATAGSISDAVPGRRTVNSYTEADWDV